MELDYGKSVIEDLDKLEKEIIEVRLLSISKAEEFYRRIRKNKNNG